MTTTANTKQALAPGQQLTCNAGTAIVRLQRVDNGHTGTPVYRVWVEQPTAVDGWDHTYADETIARIEATRAVVLFRKYRTAHHIDARRQELAAARDEQIRRAARRMHNPTTLAQIEAELDSLLTLGDAAHLAALRAGMNAIYHTAA